MIKANIPFLARVDPNIFIEAQERPKLLCYQTDGGSGQDHGNKPFQTIHFILLMEVRNNCKIVHLTSKTSVTLISIR